MNVNYNITGSESAGTQILLVLDGKSFTISDSHPYFSEILDKLHTRDFSRLEELVDAQTTIMDKLTDNVVLSGGVLHYKGQPMYDRLSQTIVDYHRAGRPFTNLINFMERLFLNPSRHSRTQLFEFLNLHNFAITDDGCFLAYKGVRNDLTSVTSGPGIVNGEQYVDAHLDNSPGNQLEFIRSEVMDDPTVACAEGLHVGTFDYAFHFGSVVVECKVDPANVVSVPKDSNFQKIRCCHYVVTRVVKQEVDPDARYDAREPFIEWLEVVASAYSDKGKLATTYVDLAHRFIEGQENPLSDKDTEALLSYAAELDTDHPAKVVYRYHVDAVIEAFYEEQDEADEEDYEDEYEEDEDEDESHW
jgi:hypothetical protein